MVFSIVHIIMTYVNAGNEEKKSNSWVAKKLISLISSLFTIFFIAITMLFTTGLIIYHITLIIDNKTTKELIKKLIFKNIGNPYNRGTAKNCKDFWTRHISMKNNYTVKDLRVKVKPEKILPKKRTTKPRISPYKGKKLKNKKESENKEEIISKSDSNSENTNNSKIDIKLSNENKKIQKIKKNEEIDNKNSKNNKNEHHNDKTDYNQLNNNQIINKIKDRIKKKNQEKNKSDDENNEKNCEKNNKINNNLKDENESDYNKMNEVEDFSDIVSEENDARRRICNTSIQKNNNNINNAIINKLNYNDGDFDGFSRLRTLKNGIFIDDDNKYKYKLAQKKLEDLSSEITIHEEINQLNTSLSIPKENSCTSSLSQS
jgi:hypothetical protein